MANFECEGAYCLQPNETDFEDPNMREALDLIDGILNTSADIRNVNFGCQEKSGTPSTNSCLEINAQLDAIPLANQEQISFAGMHNTRTDLQPEATNEVRNQFTGCSNNIDGNPMGLSNIYEQQLIGLSINNNNYNPSLKGSQDYQTIDNEERPAKIQKQFHQHWNNSPSKNRDEYIVVQNSLHPDQIPDSSRTYSVVSNANVNYNVPNTFSYKKYKGSTRRKAQITEAEQSLKFPNFQARENVNSSFKCFICGQVVPKLDLKTHMVYMHGIGKYKCDICNAKS